MTSRNRTDVALRLLVASALAVSFGFAIAPHLETLPDDLTVPMWTVPSYLALLVPYHLFRASRWVCLIRPIAPARVGAAMLVALAGYMWVALLPFRLGELARPLFLQQSHGTPVTRSLGSIAVERVVDGLVVCGCFFGGLLLVGETMSASPLIDVTLAVVTAFTAALLGLVTAACIPAAWQRTLTALVGRVSPRLAPKVLTTLGNVVEGVRGIGSLRTLAAFLALTGLYWAANIVGMWFLAGACGLELTLAQTLMVLAVMNVALLVPGGPAQFGIFQTGLVVGLALFLPSELISDRGSVFAFYLYVCQIGSITLIGLLSQLRLRLDWRAVLFGKSLR